MNLLQEIQSLVVKDGNSLGPVLLKLRVLGARLGSSAVEEWVRHESEGYPTDSDLPPYRIVGIAYKATFSGPFGSGIRNAPIPLHLIKKFAGENWTKYEVRDGIAAIDELVARAQGGTLAVDAANLILLLQGRIYPDYACNDVHGLISRASLVEIQHAVRSRLLDFTLELEKSIPTSADIGFGSPQGLPKASDAKKATQIYQQTVYGNVTTISSSGERSRVVVSVGERDSERMFTYLVNAGILESDAKEFTEIVASEEPGNGSEPFGERAREWLAANLKKAVDGTWNTGVAVATKVLTEAALAFYGLK